MFFISFFFYPNGIYRRNVHISLFIFLTSFGNRILTYLRGEHSTFDPMYELKESDPKVLVDQVNSEACHKAKRGATSGMRFKGLNVNTFDQKDIKFHTQSDIDKLMQSNEHIKRSDLLQGRIECEKWSVVTTIFHPSESIIKQATLPGWCLVVVADMKTPADFRSTMFGELGENRSAIGHDHTGTNGNDHNIGTSPSTLDSTVTVLTPDEQTELAKFIPFIGSLPWNSFARKNVGYLYAILHGAKYVWDFDDDNVLQAENLIHEYTDTNLQHMDVIQPYSHEEVERMKLISDRMDPFKSIKGNATAVVKKTHGDGAYPAPPVGIDRRYDSLIGKSGGRHRGGSRNRGRIDKTEERQRRLTKADVDETAKHFTVSFNPYPVMGAPYLPSWPRGLPIEDIKVSSKMGDIELYYKTNISISNIGVVQSLADNDPDVDAMYRVVQPLPFSFKEVMMPCVVPNDRLAPYNAQATLFYYNTLWSLILPITVHGRVADIWRSYITMRLCRELGIQLVFSPPMVAQFRNAHDYLADFDAEDDLYKRSGTLLKQLTEWQASSTTLPGMMEELWVYLYERDYIMLQDVLLLQQWIEALTIIGYNFPAPTQESVDKIKKAKPGFL